MRCAKEGATFQEDKVKNVPHLLSQSIVIILELSVSGPLQRIANLTGRQVLMSDPAVHALQSFQETSLSLARQSGWDVMVIPNGRCIRVDHEVATPVHEWHRVCWVLMITPTPLEEDLKNISENRTNDYECLTSGKFSLSSKRQSN